MSNSPDKSLSGMKQRLSQSDSFEKKGIPAEDRRGSVRRQSMVTNYDLADILRQNLNLQNPYIIFNTFFKINNI